MRDAPAGLSGLGATVKPHRVRAANGSETGTHLTSVGNNMLADERYFVLINNRRDFCLQIGVPLPDPTPNGDKVV